MTLQRYRAVYIAAEGNEVQRKTFRYDVALHESYGTIMSFARSKLVIDAPPLADVPAHIDGLIEVVILPEGRVLVCDDSFTLTYDEPNPHRLAGEASEAYDFGGFAFAGPLVIIDPIE